MKMHTVDMKLRATRLFIITVKDKNEEIDECNEKTQKLESLIRRQQSIRAITYEI